MKYLLDTDTLIYLLKGHDKVIEKITHIHADDPCTSIVNYSELLFGTYHSSKVKQNVEKITSLMSDLKILPFCEQSAEIFAKEKALLKRNGIIIADLDLMIASISIINDVTLVSNNTKPFSRLNHLKLENWAARNLQFDTLLT